MFDWANNRFPFLDIWSLGRLKGSLSVRGHTSSLLDPWVKIKTLWLNQFQSITNPGLRSPIRMQDTLPGSHFPAYPPKPICATSGGATTTMNACASDPQILTLISYQLCLLLKGNNITAIQMGNSEEVEH